MKMRGALSRSSPTRTRVGRLEAGVAAITVQPGIARSQRSTPSRDSRDHGVGARPHARHVDADRPGDDAEVGGAAREVRGVGAGDQRLGRHAAGVHAGAAEQLPLDERDRHARGGQPPGQRRTGLARAHDDGVEPAHDAQATISSAPPIATTSSTMAAGRSRPNAAASRARAARPPSVPITAPTTPAWRPPTQLPRARPIAAPDSAPVRMRAPN